ncbi:iron-sulfur cluster assembly protein, partial [Teichococcus cervicalis]
MSDTLADAVRAALARLSDPETGQDLVASGMLQGLSARDGLVQFALSVPRERARGLEPLRQAAERAAAA